jgi:gliding motility-associated-like protein
VVQVTDSHIANYNLTLGTSIFYVRIDSPNTCFQVVTLTLELVSKPIIPINDIEPLCEGNSITLNAGNNYDSYTWSTGEISQTITITQSGSYSVIVSENHGAISCTSTKNFVVVNSNIATIQEIISSDWTDNNNTITVLLQSNSQGNYEYSLNGIDFQSSNIFTDLEAGEYTVFVRDKNGCGIVSQEFYLLMYPKFFTPNGDGYNDFWKIKFSENEPNLSIKIFDRYGKLLKVMEANSIGWDGKYLGKEVTSSDYWFVVTRENGKEYKGHFSLKR